MPFNKTAFFFAATIFMLHFSFSGFCKKHNNLFDSIKSMPKVIVISVHLRKDERFILNYTDTLFEGKLLDFSNPGNTDTVITKRIFSPVPVLLTAIVTSFINNQIKDFVYEFLASPGNTLNLSLNEQNAPNQTDSLNTGTYGKNNLLANGDPYYSDFSFLSPPSSKATNQQQWETFYQLYTDKYEHELMRINTLLAQKQIDAAFYQQLIINCRLHYYHRILNWVWDKNEQVFHPALAVISKNIPQIEQVINDQHIFLSGELTSVIDGMVRAKVINKGMDDGNETNIYNEACSLDLGRFKAAYLTSCIINAPVKTTGDFSWILNDYKARYKSTVYTVYVDSVLKSHLEGKHISVNDIIVSLDGKRILWDYLIKSKKHIVVIDFWASWCLPCRHQLPLMDSIKTLLKKCPITFITINLDDNMDDWKTASMAEKVVLGENNYHLMNGRKSQLAHKLHIQSIPRYLVLKNSKIVASDFYQPTEQSFVKELKKLMGYENN